MKKNEVIKGLQEILNRDGDLDCYYSIDDEGNGYQQVIFDAITFHICKEDIDGNYVDEVYEDNEIEEKIKDEEYEINDFIKICVIN